MQYKPGMNAETMLKNGEYFSRGKDENGRRQDEIAKIGNLSIWAYHGFPIVTYNHITKEFRANNAGYETKTTKDRINLINGYWISQKNFKWYNKGKEWENEDLGLSINTYHKIDGWRGYSSPIFAVAGASNTGGWSDSPCRPETVEEEMAFLSTELKKTKIKTYQAWTETSNVFCVKIWLCVPGNRFEEARAIINPILESGYGRLVHKAD